MSLKIYNSLTNKLEEFIPHKSNKVNMYVCGPTVYNYIHIGNARPVIFFDTLKKYLTYKGYEVKYASNITDVDDKIIKKAAEQKKTEKEITDFFESEYFRNCQQLNADKTDFTPHATEYIPQMIEMINTLIYKGYAYEADGDVYFRVSKLKSYGQLSNQNTVDLNNGARIEVNQKKENPLDFTLWKKTDEGIKWESPFGSGRPGWHTECVVMNMDIFGEEIDIHGGGSDLKFPHHENEIAQAEAVYGNTLSKYWMHVGRLQLDGTKMSKSLGNVIFVKDLKSQDEFNLLRFLIITQPYRSSINYGPELVNQYKKEYDKLKRAYTQGNFALDYNLVNSNKLDENIMSQFELAMDNDFNTPNVLTLIQKIVKSINASVRSKEYIDLALKTNSLKVILDILGVKLEYNKLTKENREIYENWLNAKKDKNFELADSYREILSKNGVL